MGTIVAASEASQLLDSVIAPKDLCDVCQNPSGPTFILSQLRGPSDYHRMNIIPIGLERDSAEANIAYAQSDGALLDKEITRLEKTLQVLKQRRIALNQFEKQELSLFAPIRKLSMDLLHRIFLEVWDSNSYLLCHEPMQFPQIATSVSSYWRSAAQSCPFLWTKVKAMNYEDKHKLTFGEIIQKCVSFSNEMPLAIELKEGITPDVVGDISIRALAQCANRWESMTILDAQLVKSIVTILPENASFSILTTLSLHISDLSVPLLLQGAPRLVKLAIRGVNDPSHIVSIVAPPSLVRLSVREIANPLSTLSEFQWEQITDFEAYDIKYSNLGEFRNMLERMPNLESLNLENATQDYAQGSVTLPCLKTLQLGKDKEWKVLDSVLTAPALKTLRLIYDFDPDYVLDFIRRSRCSLDELHIDRLIDDYAYAPAAVRSVKTFYWTSPFSIYLQNGVNYLKWGKAPAPARFLPQLEKLNILGLDVKDQVGIPYIIAMLKTRLPRENPETNDAVYARGGRFLTDINITFNGALSEKYAANFEEFVQSDVVRNSKVNIVVSDGSREISTNV